MGYGGQLSLLGVGRKVGSSAANPQIQFYQNFERYKINANVAYSNGRLSLHHVEIPLSLSFNNVVLLVSNSGNGTRSFSFGLYSLNASSFSLANSASASWAPGAGAYSWISLATSATQNITPGQWWFAVNVRSSGSSSFSLGMQSSMNPANAIGNPPYVARMTVSTAAMPGSIATSALDITGSDAFRQPYVIITA